MDGEGLPRWEPVQRVRIPSQLDPPIAFAHRGASAHAPGNTIAAFELALRLGATGLETDVWLTADRVPVLDHDGRRRRGLRTIRFADLRREDLPESVPTLADLYASCGSDFELSLDIKDPRAALAVVEVAAHHGAAERLWLCSADREQLEEWVAFGQVRVVHSTAVSRLEGGPERHVARLAESGVSALNLRFRDWSGGMSTLCHRFGVLAFGWDAQHERMARDLVRMGLDGIYSDDVEMLTAVMAEEAGA